MILINQLENEMNVFSYEKESELKNSIETQCHSIELKFRIYLLDYLINFYIEFIKNNSEIKHTKTYTQFLNILFGLVFQKRTVIAS